MHVNNYFIQTLVLVFNSSPDNVKITFENVNITSGDNAHSLHKHEEFVIGKNIGWSTLVQDTCNDLDPPVLDLDSIKRVIEYELVKNSAHCVPKLPQEIKECVPKFIRKDCYGRLIPPHLWTKESYKDGIWPAPDFCIISKYNVDQLIIYTDTSVSLIKDFDAKELYDWMLRSPNAEVVILLVHEKWPEKFSEKVTEAFSNSFVLTWDWSMYTYSSSLFTAAYSKLIGERLSQWLLDLGIPGDRITIIGFSVSAHAAGFAGKYLREHSESKIRRIIAINPSSEAFESPEATPNQRLSANDAKQVYVIHYGTNCYHTSLGTIDVYINNTHKISSHDYFNPSEGSSSLEIFAILLTYLPLRPENVQHKVLEGFPFNIILTAHGNFFFDVGQLHSVTVDTEITSITKISRKLIIKVGYPPAPTTLEEQNIEQWLTEHPSGKIIILLKDEKITKKWLKSLLSRLEQPDTKILIIDWSNFIMKDDMIPLNMVLVNCIAHFTPRIILIGIGSSAHLAITVASKVNEITLSELHKIVLLNPPNTIHDRLESSLAHQILVIDSNYEKFIPYPNTVDIQIDHGMFYCVLEDDDATTKCLNQLALKFFIEMLRYEQIPLRNSSNVISAAPYEDDALPNGLYESFISDFFVEFDVSRAPFGFDNSKLKYKFYRRYRYQSSVDVLDWLSANPNGEIFIIITFQNTEDVRFLTFMQSVSKKWTSQYTVAVDWSKYYFPSAYTNDYVRLVADAIARRIIDLKFPVEMITLFGSEESAQVASLIAKTIQQEFGRIIRKIVAYNPEGEANYIPKKYYLSRTDAIQVLATHIDSGSTVPPVPCGTIDVFISFVDKSYCRSYKRKKCLNHIMYLLIRSINEVNLPIFDSNGNELVGFPFNIDINKRGVYNLLLKLSAAGLCFGIRPENILGHRVKVDLHLIRVILGSDSYEITSNIDVVNVILPCEKETVIILNDKQYGSEWAINLKNAILESGFSKTIYEIDLSAYKEFIELPNRIYLKAMADVLASWIIRMKLCTEKLTIIGLGNGAHLAGLIGKDLAHIVSRIIALNPTKLEWINMPETERLCPSDAQQVIVIHTESSTYGFVSRLGTVDIYVDRSVEDKLRCNEYDELVCFHLYAAQVLTMSLINSSSILIESSDGRLLSSFPFYIDIHETATFYIHLAYERHTVVEEHRILVTDIYNMTLLSIGGSRIRIRDVNDWLEQNPDGKIVIGVENDDHAWRVKLKSIPSTQNFFIFYQIPEDKVDLAVYRLTKWIHLTEIAQEQLILVGSHITTNIVGRVGRILQENYHFLARCIIALNPEANLSVESSHSSLTSTDAQQVVLISTDTDHDLNSLGTVNIISSKGCGEESNMDCNTNKAVTILIAYINNALTINQYFVLPTKQVTDQHGGVFVVEVPERDEVVVDQVNHHTIEVISNVINGYEFKFNIDVSIIRQWFKRHPLGEVVVILKGDNICNQPKWDEYVVEMLNDNYTDVYPIVIDWSRYNDNSNSFTGYPQLLIQNLASYIYKNKIPIDRLVFIGVGKSAHIAGLISKQLYYISKTLPYKIIAINPYWIQGFISLSEAERLSKTDAAQVVIIDTDNSLYSTTPEALGTINVFVGGDTVQREEKKYCLQSYAMQVFVLALYHPKMVVFNKYLDGFPLIVSLDTVGQYIVTEILKVYETECSTKRPAELTSTKSPSDRGTTSSSQCVSEKSQPTTTEEPSTTGHVVSEDFNSTLGRLIEEHGKIFVIITAKEEGDNDWVQKFRYLISKASFPSYVFVIQWSLDESLTFDETQMIIRRVANQVVEWMFNAHVPTSLVTLIGFGTSAHVAGVVGKIVHIKYNWVIDTILALNPAGVKWIHVQDEKKLCKFDANNVIVVHTETHEFGYVSGIGTLDILINPDNEQPWCHGPMSARCSYVSAISIFLEGVKHMIFKKLYILPGFPFNIRHELQGTQKIILGAIEDPIVKVIEFPPKNEYLVEVEHVHGNVYIIITDGEEGNRNWADEFNHLVSNSSTPSYVLVVDWSPQKQQRFNVNLYITNVVADQITQWIHRMHIPPSIITVIGFGTSGHVAGMVGKKIQQEFGWNLCTIIALNPAGNQWIDVPDSDKLSKTDANRVIVVHTETREYGYIAPLGTVDVFINSNNEQPWCTGPKKAHCAYLSVISIFLEGVKRTLHDPTYVYILPGFPFTIVHNIKGVFKIIMETEEDNKSVIQIPDSKINIIESEKIRVVQWLRQHRDGKVVLIITGRMGPDPKWPERLLEILMEDNCFVIIIDWSAFKSHIWYKSQYTALVVQTIVKYIAHKQIPLHTLTLIGFDESAHVAGMVGKHIRKLHRIIALNPTGRAWISLDVEERLSPTDASQVLVIHTETKNYGYPTSVGTLDVFVNKPDVGQPWCDEPNRDLCSHFSALDIFLKGLKNELAYPDGILPDLQKFPFGIDLQLKGNYYINVLLEKKKILCEIGPSGVIITPSNGMKYIEWIGTNSNSTDVIIVLTGHETNSLVWISTVVSALAQNNYVLLVDWSHYKQTDHGLLVAYINVISKLLSDYIRDQSIPLDRLTIIGFGNSAHLAGLIGRQQTSLLYKIIALDPTGGHWASMTYPEKLNAKDATEVVIIHTETKLIGYPDNLGTVDVYIKNLDDVCLTNERAVCLHEFSIQIFLYFIKLHLPSFFGIYANHFPLISIHQFTGVYFIDYHYLVSPKYWPVEVIEPDEWPAVDFNLAKRYDASNVRIKLYKPTQEVITFDVRYANSVRSVVQDLANYFIIVTEEPAARWAEDLKNKLLKASTSNYVIIVDWSMYVFNSYMFTASYSKRVADTVAGWVYTSEIPPENLEIIGYATSGHVAGLMGNYLRVKKYIVEKIVALDPDHRMWSNNEPSLKVNMQSGKLVQVIHTNIGNYGYSGPLGHIDIYVNDGKHQPHCKRAAKMNKCSHMAAVLYYMDSIGIRAQATEAKYFNGTVKSQGTAFVNFGYWLASYIPYKPGVYRLDTNEDYHYLNGYVELSKYDLVTQESFNSRRYIHRDLRQIAFSGSSNYLKPEFVVKCPLYRIPLPTTWFSTYNGGQVFIILDDEFHKDLHSEWMGTLKETILRNVPNSLVLSFTWMKYNFEYKIDSELARPIGETIADILKIMLKAYVPFDKIHIIGHSVGAHVGGFIGKRLKEKYGMEVARLTALDPAGPIWSDDGNEDSRLTRKDAKMVDVVHSDIDQFGYPKSIGGVDFYVNFGRNQHGCEGHFESFCSHRRSIELFIESFDRKSLALHVEMKKDVLIYSRTTAFATFGYYLEPDTKGPYIILTNRAPPFLKIQEEKY